MRSLGKLLCSSVVLTVSSDWHIYNPLLCHPALHYCWGGCCPCFFYTVGGAIPFCTTPPTLLLGQMLPVSYTVGCAILYCATPPYTTIKVDAACFLSGWLRDPLTVLPPLHSYWAILNCVTSLHCTLVKCCLFSCNGRRGVGRPFTVLPPYTAPKLNAACFRAMSVGVLGDSQLCYPTTLHLG